LSDFVGDHLGTNCTTHVLAVTGLIRVRMCEVRCMRQFAKTFVAVVAFGATVVGAYVGALAVNLLWAANIQDRVVG
jgi:hypothetical protein